MVGALTALVLFRNPPRDFDNNPSLLQQPLTQNVPAHLLLPISQITYQFGTFKHNRKSLFGYIRAFCKCRPLNALWSATGKICFCGCWECALFRKCICGRKQLLQEGQGLVGWMGSAFSFLEFSHPCAWRHCSLFSWVNDILWVNSAKENSIYAKV